MDKYEYRLKTEEMLSCAAANDYRRAESIADTIDWRRVKSVSMLCAVSDIYDECERYEDAREILFIAYDRAPKNRKIIFGLTELAIKTGDLQEARDCLDEYVAVAPHDGNKYVLRYELLKAQRAPIEEQIRALEEFKQAEYTERWAYELACLYDKAGMTSKCITECNDIFLWFSDGKYVRQALELKRKYRALTSAQEDMLVGTSEDEEDLESTSRQRKASILLKDQKRGRERKGIDETRLEQERQNLEQQANDQKQAIDEETPEEEEGMLFTEWAEEEAAESGQTTEAQNQDSNEDDEDYSFVNAEADNDRSSESEKYANDFAEEGELFQEGQPFSEGNFYKNAREQEEKERESEQIRNQQMEAEIARRVDEEYNRRVNADLAQQLEEATAPFKAQIDELNENFKKQFEELSEEFHRHMESAQAEAKEATERANAAEELAAKAEVDKNQALDEIKKIQEEITRQIAAAAAARQAAADAERRVAQAEAEKKAVEELAAEAEKQRQEESKKLQEKLIAEEARLAEEKQRLEEEKIKAEEARRAEEARLAEEARRVEEARLAEEARRAEEARLAEEARRAEEARLAEEARKAEEARLAEEARRVEEARLAEEARRAELVRLAEEARKAEDARKTQELKNQLQQEEIRKKSEERRTTNISDDVRKLMDELEIGSNITSHKEKEKKKEKNQTAQTAQTAPMKDDVEENLALMFGTPKQDNTGKIRPTKEIPVPTLEELDYEETPEETSSVDDTEEIAIDDIAAALENMSIPGLEEQEPEEVTPFVEKSAQSTPVSRYRPAEIHDDYTGGGLPLEQKFDLEVQSRIGTDAGLTEDQKNLFSYFVPVRGMSEQLVEVLRNDQAFERNGTSSIGNLLVAGPQGSGKTVLAVDVVKAIQKQRKMKSGKIAIISAEAFNKKSVPDTLKKIQGGSLIIENAGKLENSTIRDLNQAMEGQTGETLFVLEDQKESLNHMLSQSASFAAKFNSSLEVPVFINDELVTFGQSYANEHGYKIEEMGILALYSRIDMMQREDHAVTVAEVKDIMDAAFEHSKKTSMRRTMTNLFKRSDKSEMIPLLEDDFA